MPSGSHFGRQNVVHTLRGTMPIDTSAIVALLRTCP